MSRCYLGIDIGTFESKGVLVNQNGHILASAAKAHKLIVPQPGWAEHRADEDWWNDFVYLSNTLIAQSRVAPTDISAVATSAIGPCMLPLDSDGAPLMNAILYGVDTRAASEIEELTAQIGADVILERCGNALTSQSIGPKILWFRRARPEIFARTARVVTSTTYLVHKLTNEYVIDHYSAAGYSPLYLIDTLDWSEEFAPGVVNLGMLPRLRWTTEIAGGVTREAAAQTGLAAGTPVTVGTIDAAAEAISVGVAMPGAMLLMYGSTVFIIEVTDHRVRDPRLWYAPWLFEGQHASMAGLATSGTLSHWFREQFGRELGEGAISELAHEAQGTPPGAHGLVLLPYFSGERTPIHDSDAKGVIFGLDLTHSRGDIYRALFEGIAMGTRHVLETYDLAGISPRAIYAAGGGLRNGVWSQATSDVSERSQILREKTVGASYGDAFLAALAVDDVRLEDIDKWNPIVGEIAPRRDLSALYDKQYGIFRRLYDQTKELMREISA